MTSPFHDAFREELVQAGERRLRRRRRRIRTAVGSVVAAVSVVGVSWVVPNPAVAEITVREVDGYVEVNLNGPVTSNEEVLEALRDHGIEAEVRSAPTGPSAVGRFLSALIEPDDPTRSYGLEQLKASGGSFGGFRIIEDLEGTVTLTIGRAAEPGEPYEMFTNAFDVGEPLRCAGVLGRRLSDAAERLEGYTVTVITEQPDPPISLEEALAGDLAESYVIRGAAGSATSFLLTVSPVPTAAESGC